MAQTQDALTKASTEAAENFVEHYYEALKNHRGKISSYFVPATTLPDGKTVPGIVWNGNKLSSSADLQSLFENNMPWAHFEAQSVNCAVLNPHLDSENGTAEGKGGNPVKAFSVTVQVSGYVRLEQPKEGPMKAFSESFILVPNPEKPVGRGRSGTAGPQGAKSWLIQVQNFRYVT